MKKFLLFLFLFVLAQCISYAGERVKVEYVKTSDGDTARIKIAGETTRVRFLGINTPEVSGEDKVEEPYGNEALEYTKNKLDNANKIEIEYDDVAEKEDRFGRKLAWIWVDGELFELELLEQGLAKTYMLKNDYKYATELKQAEQKAKEKKIGVWSLDESITQKVNDSSNSNNEIQETNSHDESNEYKNDSEESTTDWRLYFVVLMVVFIVLYRFKNEKEII